MKKGAAKPRARAVKKSSSGMQWVQIVASGRGSFCRRCEELVGHYYPAHHAPHVPPNGCRCSLTLVVAVHDDDVPEWLQ